LRWSVGCGIISIEDKRKEVDKMKKIEIEQKIAKKKDEIKNWKASKDIATEAIKDLTEDVIILEKDLADLTLMARTYRDWQPSEISQKYWFISECGEMEERRYSATPREEAIIKHSLLGVFQSGEEAEEVYEKHMAGEQLKRLISIENAEQGWQVSWSGGQNNYYLDAYDLDTKEVFLESARYEKSLEDELYFSRQSSEDEDFLNKIKSYWLMSIGISGS